MANNNSTSSTPTKREVVPFDSGKTFCLLPKDDLTEQHIQVEAEGYQWWVLKSFVDLEASPYGRIYSSASKQPIVKVEANYLKYAKNQRVFQDIGHSPPYKTRSTSGRTTATVNKKMAGSATRDCASKSSGMPSALSNKSTPAPLPSPSKVPYIKGSTKIPQIPPGQTINPEFVREELYTRVDEIYTRLDDPISGIATSVTKLQNAVQKLQEEKRTLEEKVAVLETEVTAEKIGLKDQMKVARDQISLMQTEIRTLKAKKMDLLLHSTDGDPDLVSSFEEFEKFKKAIEEENIHLAQQIEWLIASVDQNTLHIDHLQVMTATNAEKLMQTSIKVGGVDEHKDIKPRQAAINFLKDIMKLKFDSSDVHFAYRKGEAKKSLHSDQKRFPRFLFMKVSQSLYHKIWNNRRSLGGKKSPEGWKYFVSLNKPAILRAADRRYADRIKQVIEEDKNKDKSDKRFAKVSNGKLFVGNEYQPDPISPPGLRRRVQLENTQGGLINSFDMLESSIYPMEGSNNFQAFAIKVASFQDVELAYCRVKKENVYATHVMMACYFEKPGEGDILFSCDDGEHEAGLEIEKELKDNGISNLAVFVTRYRFKHFELGPKRFIAIREVTKKVLQKVNDIWTQQDNALTDSASDGEDEVDRPGVLSTSAMVTNTQDIV